MTRVALVPASPAGLVRGQGPRPRAINGVSGSDNARNKRGIRPSEVTTIVVVFCPDAVLRRRTQPLLLMHCVLWYTLHACSMPFRVKHSASGSKAKACATSVPSPRSTHVCAGPVSATLATFSLSEMVSLECGLTTAPAIASISSKPVVSLSSCSVVATKAGSPQTSKRPFVLPKNLRVKP